MRRLFVAASSIGVVAFLAYPALTSAPVGFLPAPFQPGPAAVLFGGDIMFDRTVRTAMDAKGGDYIFSCIDELLQSADLVVANLEGPITAHASRSAGTAPGGEFNYTFTFPTSTAELLARHNIRLVNIGNNHILNFGKEGERSTISYLTAAGVGYFGDTEASAVAHVNIGVGLAFINYNQFMPQEHTNILKYVSMSSTTLREIKEARDAGEIPIVYAHWGEEYVPASASSRELAHSFIDAGAELVVGSHPHVVQEHETYAGKEIYYSLGNFVFDQYWNEAVRAGLLLKVVFDENGVRRIEEIPIRLERDRRTCPTGSRGGA